MPHFSLNFCKLSGASLNNLFSQKQIFKEPRSKIQPENSETEATPKRVWIRPKHSASAAFS